jgi:cytochrome c biogenesis protein CcmG/thiol:disulfide interchange protein DsbE
MKIKVSTHNLVAAVALFLAIAAFGADAPALEQNKKRADVDALHGKPAPPLKLKEWINSKALTLADLKGKIVVLDFWATWCGPCLAAVPHTNELMKKYADKGVVIIGVCAVKGAEKMAATVKAKGIEYPVAIDDGGATGLAYRIDSFPDYYIIDRKGNLRWGDMVNTDLEKAIKILIQE